MTTIKNNKLIGIAVILLLIANALTLGLFWFRQSGTLPRGQQVNHHGDQMQQGPANFLIRELNFDEKQQEEYMKLVQEHRRSAEEIRGRIRVAKDRLFALLGKTAIGDSERRTAAAKVSQNTEALDLLTLQHFEQVRKLCSPVQQEKFDRIIQEVVRMMGRSHDGPPPGGPGLDGPPEGPHQGPPPD